MNNIENNKINKSIGKVLQKARLEKGLTQEQLADQLLKSPKTISQIETGKDGTSKKIDVEFMNLLEITPNELYKDFITNENIKYKIDIFERINKLSPNKLRAVEKYIDILEELL